MNSYDQRGKWRGQLVRCLAIFFVLFTFADLAFAHYIQHDGPSGSSPTNAGATPTVDAVDDLAFTCAASDSEQEESSEAICNDECCFCCARVIPGASTAARTPTSESRAVLTFYIHDSPPTPFLSGTFRPPRHV